MASAPSLEWEMSLSIADWPASAGRHPQPSDLDCPIVHKAASILCCCRLPARARAKENELMFLNCKCYIMLPSSGQFETGTDSTVTGSVRSGGRCGSAPGRDTVLPSESLLRSRVVGSMGLEIRPPAPPGEQGKFH